MSRFSQDRGRSLDRRPGYAKTRRVFWTDRGELVTLQVARTNLLT